MYKETQLCYNLVSFDYAGPEDVKLTMATTLAEMELTDHNKESLFEGGVLGPLLHFVSHGDTHMKNVAAKALRNLSSLPKNGLQMIKEAAVRPLLDSLFNHSASSSSLREHAAGTIMHLAVSTVSQESSQIPVSLLESDEDILMLFSLINLTGPEIQQSIIQTFQALCQSPSAPIIKTKLSQVFILLETCFYFYEKVGYCQRLASKEMLAVKVPSFRRPLRKWSHLKVFLEGKSSS